ncbi:MAG: cell envelope integrity protein TolA [Acidobacteriota bacterium]
MKSRFQVPGSLLMTVCLTVVLAGAFDLLAASTLAAQTGGDNYKTLTKLGGGTRFDVPLKDSKTVQKWIAKKRSQEGVKQVLDKAGLASISQNVIDMLTKADPEQVKDTEFQPGGTLVWMAFRFAGKPDIVRNVKWGGKKPFAGFTFVIDDLNQTYTFIVPKPCSNLALVSSEPSREKARLDAERAAKEKAEADRLAAEKAAADKARLEAERLAKEKAEADRLAKEKAEAERVAKEKAEAERVAKEKAEAERRAFESAEKVKFFVSPLFGKERRTRATNSVDSTLCSPLLGIKVGPEIKVSPTVKINPAAGVAVNFEKSSNTAVFAEVEFNLYSENQKSYIGAGVGVWDVAHSDWVTPTLSLQFGREMWNNAKHNKVYFVGEGRMFLRKTSDISNNYQFWAGLRWVIK